MADDQTDPLERLVNLALFFAGCGEPVSAARVREEVHGYAAEQDEPAYLRMFERDKEVLRAAGLAIVEDEGLYRLDPEASFSVDIDLAPEEAVAIGVAASACLSDPAFPFGEDLRLALAKLGADLSVSGAPAALRLADEEPEQQGVAVAALSRAAQSRKTARFSYTNASGSTAPHAVDPYGLFVREGRWYVVGRDRERDEIRTYAVARIADLSVNTRKPKSADFDRPDSFDVRGFIALPFQYGVAEDEFEALLLVSDPSAQLRGLVSTSGVLVAQGPHVEWRVLARSRRRLARFVVEHAPAIRLLEPEALRTEIDAALAGVQAAHE